MKKIKLADLKKDVIDILSFITLHEIAHIKKGHQFLDSTVENNRNNEFEADDYAIERMMLSYYDFRKIISDILFLPIYRTSTKSTVKRISYNSPDLKDFSECRLDNFIIFGERVGEFKFITGRVILGLNNKNIDKIINEINRFKKELPNFKRINKNCKKEYLGLSTNSTTDALIYLDSLSNILLLIKEKKTSILIKTLNDQIKKDHRGIYHRIHIKNIIDILFSLSRSNIDLKFNNDFFVTNAKFLINNNINMMGSNEIGRLYDILAELILFDKELKLSNRLEKSHFYARKAISYNDNLANSYQLLYIISLINRDYNKAEKYILMSIDRSKNKEMTDSLKIAYDILVTNKSRSRDIMLKVLKKNK